MVAAVMFKVALPVLVSVTFCVELLPTLTLLNATDVGLILNWACVPVPVPLRPITRGEPGAVLAINTLPVTLPAEVGANVTVNVAVAPGLSVCGESALMLKPVPLALAELIERLAVPVFVNVTFTDEVFPTRTLPKGIVEGFALKAP
jgi:hypothetical protein